LIGINNGSVLDYGPRSWLWPCISHAFASGRACREPLARQEQAPRLESQTHFSAAQTQLRTTAGSASSWSRERERRISRYAAGTTNGDSSGA
jgi:hypothetical protein